MTKDGFGISPGVRRIPKEDVHLMLYAKNNEMDIHLRDSKRLPGYHPPITHEPLPLFWERTLEQLLRAGYNRPYPTKAKAYFPNDYGIDLLGNVGRRTTEFTLKGREARIRCDLHTLLEELEAQRTEITREGKAEEIQSLPEPYRFGVTPELKLLTVQRGVILSHPMAHPNLEPLLGRVGILQLFDYLKKLGLEGAFLANCPL